MASRRWQAESGGFNRSGRFSFDNTTMGPQSYKIIQTGSKSVYRFFNSGESEFKVKQKGATGTGVTIESKNSFDAEVSGEVEVIVKQGVKVEGIYDFVESNFSVRNGRYKGTVTSTKKPTLIMAPPLTARPRSVYRIFNSGAAAFNVIYGAASDVTATIDVRQSYDFIVEGVVQLAPVGTEDTPVKAIYDSLDASKPIRSGRFKRRVADNPGDLHEIINFTKYDRTPFLMYRIFNSGKNSLQVVAQSETHLETVLNEDLAENQAFDFGFNGNGINDNKRILVRSLSATAPIEGIYEFLGFDS